MFKKDKIDFVYRLVCLITFCFVILFSNNILTLALLSFFFFLSTKNENNILYTFFFLFSFIFFAFGYLGENNYFISKIFIIAGYLYYFLIIPSITNKIKKNVDIYLDKKFHIEEKNADKSSNENFDKIVDEKNNNEHNYIRFANNHKKKVIKKDDLPTTIYVTYHLTILLLTIVLGGFI